jgi:hypothetical protein
VPPGRTLRCNTSCRHPVQGRLSGVKGARFATREIEAATSEAKADGKEAGMPHSSSSTHLTAAAHVGRREQTPQLGNQLALACDGAAHHARGHTGKRVGLGIPQEAGSYGPGPRQAGRPTAAPRRAQSRGARGRRTSGRTAPARTRNLCLRQCRWRGAFPGCCGPALLRLCRSPGQDQRSAQQGTRMKRQPAHRAHPEHGLTAVNAHQLSVSGRRPQPCSGGYSIRTRDANPGSARGRNWRPGHAAARQPCRSGL